MKFTRLSAVFAFSLLSSSLWAAIPVTLMKCELTAKVDEKLMKIEVRETADGVKTLAIASVSQAVSNLYSEDSWDIWSMARVAQMNVDSAIWEGHTFPVFKLKASDSNSTVTLQADPSAAMPNAAVTINGLSFPAHCR